MKKGSFWHGALFSETGQFHLQSTLKTQVTGRILDMGGKTSANVHLAVAGESKTIKLDSSMEYLRGQKENMLYHDVQVRVLAEQNIQTRELRNLRLLEFAGKPPSYNGDELNQLIEKGTKAWADVENVSQWVLGSEMP